MIKFNKCKLNDELLDQWVQTEVNVLLIGEKGVGKSHHILNTFKRNNLKYAYFSGATLDPWIHLLGIPKAKTTDDGKEKMEFVLPENLDDDVEAIFCDEWNRTNKVVRNALLELQQFKSINGRKFPKLKMVWGAVNPPKGEDEEAADYDVDELDPAQLDRFHIIVELPNTPDKKYFVKKYGAYHGKILVEWWHEQPKDALKILSPRRLDYVGECFKKGLDVRYLLPVSSNVKELVQRMSRDETEEMNRMILENPTDEEMKVFLADEKNFLKYKKVLTGQKYWNFLKYASKEFLTEEIKTNDKFAEFAMYRSLLKDSTYRAVFAEITKSDSNNISIKILKSLIEQNFIPDAPQKLSDFVGSTPPFTICKKPNNAQIDNFSAGHVSWVNINTSHKYDPSQDIYKMITVDRKHLIKSLAQSWANIKNVYHGVNFMMASLSSMQKNTISQISDFIPVLGSMMYLAKKNFDNNTLARIVNDLKRNENKISKNRTDEYISYLCSDSSFGVVPESFSKKVRDIRTVLTISNNDTDFLDLLK